MRLLLCRFSETCSIVIIFIIIILITNSLAITDHSHQSYNSSRSCRFKRHIVFPQKATLVEFRDDCTIPRKNDHCVFQTTDMQKISDLHGLYQIWLLEAIFMKPIEQKVLDYEVTLSLLKSTIVHRLLNTIHEADFPFPLPQSFKYFNRGRRLIHEHFENGLNLFGFNGKQCVQRAVCEVKDLVDNRRLQHEDLAQEILNVIFRSTGFNLDCSPYLMDNCPVSIIDIMHYWFYTVIKEIEKGITE